ncbi:MAG: DUF302 domain-containing protein [Candidatus Parabeggiatoa sp. nov. 2]|nr:MAG: hypothetical protein B6247_08580 [Beggiatoa sp. 4572_84]RKZ54993.1 MAG: DUF302 domain-containing protein [Gammaproteobacteria bacterium]HEC84021.1 DUF302 domain-containing protein [Thioploca sp.]
MRQLLIVSLLLFVPVGCSYNDNGLVNVEATRSVKETTDHLESLLKEKGMTIFARINHAEGAKRIGKELRPTELLIFGNPKAGAPLMQCKQAMGIDLPLKMLIWEDENGQVWLTYNNPEHLANRHKLAGCAEKVIKTVAGNLTKLTHKVAK